MKILLLLSHQDNSLDSTEEYHLLITMFLSYCTLLPSNLIQHNILGATKVSTKLFKDSNQIS